MDASTKSTASTDGSAKSEKASLAEALKKSIEIKDRKWRTKTYHQCFTHSDAVRWMCKHRGARNEEEAVRQLNELREAGYIQHVVDPHKPFRVGQTRKLYFCFVDDVQSHVQQKPSKETARFIQQSKLTKQMLKEVIQTSDEYLAIQYRLNRMASSVQNISEAQRSVQTKLEIIHQATISLIQATVYSGILLLVLLAYTAILIIPTLSLTEEHSENALLVGAMAIATLGICGCLFMAQGNRLFSVWLSLDTCVVQAAEGEDAVEDYEVNSGATTAVAPTRGLGRRTSSILLKEPLLRKSSDVDASAKLHQPVGKSIQQRQPADLPPTYEWPHRPVMVCVNTPVCHNLKVDSEYGNGPCPIGKPFRFSSDLFEGQCLIRLRDVPNSDNPSGDAAYFTGRRRLFQTIVQGRFKEALSVSDVLTGHEFVKPLKNLPHPWILKAATNLIGKLAPGADIQVLGNNPTMLASLAATSQVVRMDEPGNEPDINGTCDDDILEDCSLLGGKFSSGTISATGRKLHLANPKRAANYTFDTESVYTFDFYQSLLNASTYSLDLGVANIGMARVLNGQPIQALCKTADGRYLWSFQIWHESLLPPPNDNELSIKKAN